MVSNLPFSVRITTVNTILCFFLLHEVVWLQFQMRITCSCASVRLLICIFVVVVSVRSAENVRRTEYIHVFLHYVHMMIIDVFNINLMNCFQENPIKLDFLWVLFRIRVFSTRFISDESFAVADILLVLCALGFLNFALRHRWCSTSEVLWFEVNIRESIRSSDQVKSILFSWKKKIPSKFPWKKVHESFPWKVHSIPN